MNPSPLLARLSRFTGGAADARENRLTEVTAAVLDTIPGLPTLFVEALLANHLGSPSAERVARLLAELNAPAVRVQTQLSIAGGYVDLGLSFTEVSGARRTVVVWVENKDGADLHGPQLTRYGEQISSMGADAALVVLLAPRGQIPATDEALTVSWQSVADRLLRARPSGGWGDKAWLLEDFFNFLRTRKLMDPDGLTSAHAASLSAVGDALDALLAVSEAAAHEVDARWNQAPEDKRRFGKTGNPTAYHVHGLRDGRPEPWNSGYLEWGLRETRGIDYLDAPPRSSWAFYAGISFGSNRRDFTNEAVAEWRGRLTSDRFDWVFFDNHYRLLRILYPEQLLQETSTGAQAERLASWVTESFDAAVNEPWPSGALQT